MPAIMPVSDLRNYNEVLREVRSGSPVFLTKNGRGRYAVIDIADYERMEGESRLLAELSAGVESGKRGGWLSATEVHARFEAGQRNAG